MDPTQTTNPQDNQQGQGFVPFGGNPPQPPTPPVPAPLSMADPLDAQGGMPPFHFDESDFVIPASTPPAPGATDTSVPFGGTPAPLPVVAPVVDGSIASVTSPTVMEMPPVATIDSTSPFAPRPDLDDDTAEVVSTTVETQTGSEPFSSGGFDLPSFDSTPTETDNKSDAGPFSLPTPAGEIITADEKIPETETSFELPPVETTTTSTHEAAMPSFDVATSTTTDIAAVSDSSFDLPVFEAEQPTSIDITTPPMPEPTMPVSEPTMDETKEVPSFESTSPMQENASTPESANSTTASSSTPEEVMPTPPMPTATIANDAVTTEPPTIANEETDIINTNSTDDTTNNTTPPTSIEESVTTTMPSLQTQNPISEAYDTFVQKLTQLLDLTHTETVSLVGHHTDDEHISYEFSHDETESIVIKHHDLTTDKSSTTHTLAIDHSDGLSVYLDDELLADYSDTSVVVDEQISYYINDKLSKFTLMIESEYDRMNKKTKEEEEKKKKLLADLRAF